MPSSINEDSKADSKKGKDMVCLKFDHFCWFALAESFWRYSRDRREEGS